MDKILQFFKQAVLAFKHGSKEDRINTGLVLLLAVGGTTKYLPEDLQKVVDLDRLHSKAPWLAPTCSLLALGLFVWLFVTWWKQLVPRVNTLVQDDSNLPTVLLGARAFGPTLGAFFQHLERSSEISQIVNAYNDVTVPIIVVRGQSGAGKTSLLKSGFAWWLAKDKKPFVYAEMSTDNALTRLHAAIRSDLDSHDDNSEQSQRPVDLESLTKANPIRKVIVLDQFETLSSHNPEHAAIFAFLKSNAATPPPHGLLIIIAFRREYLADWQDYADSHFSSTESASLFHISVQYFTKAQARNVLATFVAEIGIQLEESLVNLYLDEVERSKDDRCIAPVDIAVCILSLADRARRTGRTAITRKDFHLEGGASGMLAAFLRSRVQELATTEVEETAVYQALLRLGDVRNNRRHPEGATLNELCHNISGISKNRLERVLSHLESSSARLIEIISIPVRRQPQRAPAATRLRLTHDRVFEAVRRLGGALVANELKSQALFENAYWGWREFGRHHFLSGRDLRLVEANFTHFELGADSEQKQLYLNRCKQRRLLRHIITAFSVLAVVSITWSSVRFWDSSIQKTELKRMGLPADLYDYEQQLDRLALYDEQLDSIEWIRGHMKTLVLRGNLTNLREVKDLPNTVVDLDLSFNRFVEWSGISSLPASVHKLTINNPDLPKKPPGDTPKSGVAQEPDDDQPKDKNERLVKLFVGLPSTVKVLSLDTGSFNDEQSVGRVGELPNTLEELDLWVTRLRDLELDSPLPQTLKLIRLGVALHPGAEISGDDLPAMPILLVGGANGVEGMEVPDVPNRVRFECDSESSGFPVSWFLKGVVSNGSLLWRKSDGILDWDKIRPAPGNIVIGDLDGSDNFLATLPPFVTTICIEADLFITRTNYSMLFKLPRTVEEIVIVNNANSDLRFLDNLPPSVKRISINVDSHINIDFLPRRTTCVIGIAADTDDLRLLSQRLPNLEDLKVYMHRGFGDLLCLSNLTKLRKLRLEFESGTLSMDSLKGLPKSVRDLEMNFNFAP